MHETPSDAQCIPYYIKLIIQIPGIDPAGDQIPGIDPAGDLPFFSNNACFRSDLSCSKASLRQISLDHVFICRPRR